MSGTSMNMSLMAVPSLQTPILNQRDVVAANGGTYRLNQMAGVGPQKNVEFRQVAPIVGGPYNDGDTTEFILRDTGLAINNLILEVQRGPITSAVVRVNHIQRIDLSTTLVSGTYAFKYKGYTTAPLAFDATTVQMAAAVMALPSMQHLNRIPNNNATVAFSAILGTPSTTTQITFSGALSGQFIYDTITFERLNSNAAGSALVATNSVTTAGVDSFSNPSYLPILNEWACAAEQIQQLQFSADGGSIQFPSIDGSSIALMNKLSADPVLEGNELYQERSKDNRGNSTTLLHIPGLFQLLGAPVPLYGIGKEIRVRITWRTARQNLLTNYQTGLTGLIESGNILRTNLWGRYEIHPASVKTMVNTSPYPILWQSLRPVRTVYQIASSVGTTAQTLPLTGITGQVSALVVAAFVAGQTYGADFVNKARLTPFQLFDSSGVSLSGHLDMAVDFLNREIANPFWVGNSMSMQKEDWAVVTPDDKIPEKYLIWSHTENIRSDIQRQTIMGVREYDGRESIRIAFETAPTVAMTLVVWALRPTWYYLTPKPDGTGTINYYN